jgi:rhamnulokinase
MAEQAGKSPSVVNPDDPRLANPASMSKAIAAICEETGQAAPDSDAAYIRCIFDSLANRYRETLQVLSAMVPFSIDKLHVIGGGSQNALLNQFTADAIGLPVIAGPSEATAIGNCLMQAKAVGLVKDRWEIRKIVATSFPMQTYLPVNGRH